MSPYVGFDPPTTPRRWHRDCPCLAWGLEHWATIRAVQSGNSGTLFIRNDLGDLSNKASSALEGDVAPEPGYGDNETIPKAN